MKKIYTVSVILALILLSQNTYSQRIGNLDGIFYQAVAIDEYGKEIVGIDIEGKPLYNKEISVKFTITKGLNGEIQWQESHTSLTDEYGLFSLIIGHGTETGQTAYSRMLDIPWIDADQFLMVEISTRNDGVYKMVSNQQFMSVPYAFYTDDIADDAITTEKILNETILAEDIGTGSVETSEILDETILAEDIGTGSVETSEILDETILAEDIGTGSVETSEILDETILAEDIGTGSVETSEILDETILAEDIATGSVETSEILNETILAEDIGPGSVETSEILNETILAEDIATGSVATSEILNETILAEDIAAGSVATSEILNETILDEDIAAGAVTSSEIRDLTIVNNDISNATINLKTKVIDTLAVVNGGTGRGYFEDNSLLLGNGTNGIDTLGVAINGQIPIGASGGKPVLNTIAAGFGIAVTNSPGGIRITNTVTGGVQSNSNTSVNPGTLTSGDQWISPTFVLQQPTGLPPVQMGDILIASADINLQGCLMNVYLTDVNDGTAHARVVIFNPGGNPVSLGNGVNIKILVVQ